MHKGYGGGFFAGGLVATIAGVGLMRSSLQFLRVARKTRDTVVDSRIDDPDFDSPCSVTFQFESLPGVTHRAAIGMDKPPPLGTEFDLLYAPSPDPERPMDVTFDSAFQLWFLPALCLGLGVPGIIAGVLLLIFGESAA